MNNLLINRYRSEHFIFWENEQNKRVIAFDLVGKRPLLYEDLDTALGDNGIAWGDIINSRMGSNLTPP